MKPKYRILLDGTGLQKEEYDTVDQAVKAAMLMSYGSKFWVVQIIDWQAV